MLMSVILIICYIATAVVSQYANVSWVGTLSNNWNSYVDTVTDSYGDFIVSYWYVGVQSQFATSFGGAVQNTQNFNYGQFSSSFVKVSGSTGKILWTISMSGPQSAYSYQLTTDNLGNLIATGQL